MNEYRFKAKSRWFGPIYYALFILLCIFIMYIDQSIEILLIYLLLIWAPVLLAPAVLKSEYIIRNGRIILQEKSTHHDLKGNRLKDEKGIFIPISDIIKIDKESSWWSLDYVRIWVNHYKMDTYVISVKELDLFIKTLKNENPRILVN